MMMMMMNAHYEIKDNLTVYLKRTTVNLLHKAHTCMSVSIPEACLLWTLAERQSKKWCDAANVTY